MIIRGFIPGSIRGLNMVLYIVLYVVLYQVLYVVLSVVLYLVLYVVLTSSASWSARCCMSDSSLRMSASSAMAVVWVGGAYRLQQEAEESVGREGLWRRRRGELLWRRGGALEEGDLMGTRCGVSSEYS